MIPERRARRGGGHRLERWEIALVKAMIERGDLNDQDILAYFTRPTRSVNHARVAEIRAGRHANVRTASGEDLQAFLALWPNLDPETGLSLTGDELLVKAREAMIAAVSVFNGAGLVFRAELFIITAIIAWTYLMHAWFRREGIDYRYTEAGGAIKTTRQGADCYWELGRCLRHARCPLDAGVVRNLEFLLELRHEIEHRSTGRIDEAIGAKLQACCINFNTAIKSLVGSHHGLERRLPIALQFVTFGSDQRALLKSVQDLPPNIEAMLDAFQQTLTPEELADPSFAYRVVFVPILANRPSAADVAIEFLRPDSEEAMEISQVLFKPVDRTRFTATQVVRAMGEEGFPRFSVQHHTDLWRALDAKVPEKGFGRQGDYRNTWVWFESWLARVRAHCQEHADRYR